MKNYTVDEVSDKLKVSKKTVLREINRGNLKSKKVGRRHLISERDLNKYLNQDENDLKSLMEHFFESKKTEMVSLLQKMVSMPSETSELMHEERLARFIKKTFDKWGIRSVIYSTNEAVAVRASVGYAEEGVLLDAPLDTLPPGDLEKWTYPPFDGVIKNGRMYGRGTADAKAGIVCMMYTALFFKLYLDEDKFRLELVFDGGEQDGSFLGIKEVIKRGLPAKYGIIGYAGDENDLLVGARGYHRYTFTTKGLSAHTGSRYRKGINAISKMIKFISEVENIRFPKSKNELFAFGSKLTFSVIEGGKTINMVPDECVSRVDIRIIPELTKSDLDRKIEDVISKLKKKDKEFEIEKTYDVGEEAYVLDAKDEFVTKLHQLIEEYTKQNAGLTASGPAHVGNLLARYKIPCVVWGPWGLNVHSYDEYVEINSLTVTSKVYTETIFTYFSLGENDLRLADST